MSHPTRFRKGQSGNPKGRPKNNKNKKSAGPSAFDIVIDRTLTITQDGRPREVTVDEALQHKTYIDAIAGNRSARREVLKMIAKREKALAERPDPKPSIKLWDFEKEGPDPRNADEALLLLGIATLDETKDNNKDRHLLLETWAVEAALARPAACRFGRLAIRNAKDRTRDADSLCWPEPSEP